LPIFDLFAEKAHPKDFRIGSHFWTSSSLLSWLAGNSEMKENLDAQY
jgi:hypothetical protein